MTWMRLPLFVWGIYAVSIVMLTATPVLAMDTVLLAVERFIGVGLFDPRRGGDPLLWQHMFWFYSHPAVYIMILPAMGVVSELIACLRAAADLRLCRHDDRNDVDRDHQLFRLGAPHVRRRNFDLRGGRVFADDAILLRCPRR